MEKRDQVVGSEVNVMVASPLRPKEAGALWREARLPFNWVSVKSRMLRKHPDSVGGAGMTVLVLMTTVIAIAVVEMVVVVGVVVCFASIFTHGVIIMKTHHCRSRRSL